MAKKGKHKKRYKNKVELESVEPRLLFSAGLEGVLAAESLEAPADDYNQTVVEQTIDSGTTAASEASAADVRVELIFVDTDTPEYQTLLSGLLTYPDDTTSYQVFELDNSEDGIAQITATLSGFENVNAIHILSHGEEGAIDLGGSMLNSETLAANAELVSSWGSAFTDNADILIYGCDLAANEAGQSLVNSLASLTGADVAASDDLTGSAVLGGDWELEFHSGDIETELAIGLEAQQGWEATLNAAPVLDASAAKLWLSTEADVAGSAAPGLANWTDGEMLQFGAADFSLGENTTAGTFSSTGFNLDTFAGDADIDALHYVTQTVSVGSGANSLDLLAGDLLLSTQADETLTSSNTLDVKQEDVFVFRPDTPGDYTSGTFIFLLENPLAGALKGVTLVEQDTTVGDITLNAGSFVLSTGDKNLYHYTADTVGKLTTSGTLTTLIEGPDIGIDQNIVGIALVQNATTTGGVTLNAGQLLVTLENEDSDVGGLVTERRDVIALNITQTGINTLGSATGIVFDGDDVGLASNDENLNALTLVTQAGLNPIIEDITDAANTGTLVSDLVANLITDVEADPDGIAITAIDETNGSWEYSINGGSSWQVIGAVADNSARVLGATVNDLIRFVPDAEWNGSATISFRAWDSTDGSSSGDAGVNASINGGATAFSTATASGVIEVRAVNDAPVHTVPVAQSIDEDTALVFSSGTGNLIAISDDAVDGEVEVTLSVSNGTLTLAQLTGLTFSAGGDGTNSMTFFATAADANAALDGMSYLGNLNYNGAETLTINTSDLGHEGTGGTLTDNDNVSITVNAINDAPELDASEANLWLSTEADVAGSAAPGLSNWTDGEMLQFGAADFSLGENTTAGTFSSTGFNLDTFAGDADIDALHYVTQTVSTGSGANSLDLLAGDLLLSTQADETLTSSNTLDVKQEDVFVFRPDTPGDYTSGTFIFLLEKPLGGSTKGVSLVEQDTTVGDITLNAGSFVLSTGDKNLYHYTADTVGKLTTSGTLTTLIEGPDIGIDQNIVGIALVQNATTTGGVTLNAGQLLVTLDNEDSDVGGLDTERRDVIALNITQTGINTVGSATGIFFDGDDVGLASNDENLNALTLVTQAAFDPIVEDISDGANTGTLVSDLINNLITDVEGDPDGIAVTGVDDANGTWQYSIDGGSSWLDFGVVTDASAVLLSATATDSIRFVPNADWNGTASLSFRAWDGTDGSASGDTSIDTSTNGGDSAFSSATASGLITVRAVNDTPLASDDAYATNEDSALTTGNVLSNDSGIGDAPAIITTFDATSVNGGTVTYNGDGTFDYVPATNFNGSDSFTYTVTDKDGETSTATVNITVNPVNDAPVLDTAGTATLTQINENDINSSGDSVSAIIASAGGDPITDIDTTAVEGIAITWADNSNGTWQYSTDGGGTWYDIGAASDTSAFLLTDDASNRIRFVPVENFNGTAQFNYQAWDRTDGTVNATAGVDVSTNGGATAYSTTTEMASITIQPVQMVMYLSTSNDVSLSGAPGLDTWSAGEVLALGDPNINLEPGTTDGTLYRFLDLRDFDTGSVEPKVDGIHHVSKNITIGGDGGPAMDLFVGDVLFAINSNSTRLTGSDMVEITTNKKSLFMFRPDTVGDYSSGTFSVVLDNFSTNEVEGISLVEVDTMVGDTLLTAGSFLYNPGNSTNIHLYTVNGTGEGTTSGVSKILITGTDIGMGNASAKVSGLDLVESSIEIGNTSLAAGNILVTLDGNDAGIGTNNLSITSNDVFFLDVSTTTLGPAYDETGTSTANAYLLAEGADLNLDTSDEEITAISLDLKFGSGNEDPDISFPGSSVSYTENDPATLLDNGATVSDVDSFNFASGILRVDFVAGGTDADRLAIRNQGSGAGQVGVVGNTVTYAGVTIGTFIGGTSGSDPLVITFNSNADSAKVQAVLSNITYENVSDDPSTTPRDVRVVLTDGDGGTSNVEYKTINVSALNDGPAIGTNTGMTVAEGSTGTVITALMLNEADPDDSGSGVTYTVTAVPLNGTLYLSGVALVDNNTFTQADIDGGLVTYDHDDSQNLSDGFTFSLADGGENGSTPLTGQVFSITVTNVNDAPVLAAIGDQSVNETVNLSFTATATDVDVPADTLTFSLDAASLALGMTIDANTGVFNWTPTEGQGGLTPSVTVTVTDDGTGSLVDSETFTLTVNDINVAPVLGAIGDQSVNELVNLSFTATATDTDLPADTLTFSLDAASLALGMTIDANTGVFSWTPTEGQGGLTPSVTVTVTDDGTGNLVDSETFTITIADVNVAPVLGTIGDQSVNELVNLSFTATATDSDLPVDTLSFSLDAASLALGMTIDANTGVFSWTPTEGQGGLTPSVTVTVTDDGTGNLVDSETFTITVGDVNVAPVLGAIGDQSVNELVNLSFTATATDSDLPADTLTFSLDAASLALGMTIDANTGVFSWTPTEAQGGLTPSVTVTVTDDGTGNLVDSETFTVTVNDVNVAPVLGAIGDQSVNELVNLSFTATATDSDLPADTLTYSLDAASLALGMTIDANTGVFSWTPTEVQDGVHSVNITVTDDGTGTLADSETFDITVNDINTAPVLGAIGDQSVNELVNLSFTATATDSDLPADTLTFSLDAASLALGMTIDANTGVFSWTPTEVQDGVHSVNITVTDDGTGALADSETFDVTVNDINVAPVLGAIGDQSVNELVNLSFTATATDSDLPADTLTYSLDAASLALGMTIDANTGVFSWTPTEGQGGLTPSVTVTVTDDGTGNLVDSETFTITVGDVNVAPVLGAIGDQSVNELVNLSFTATATDSDLPADTLTFSLDAASLALGMTIDANTGVFNWTPTEGQGGTTPSVTVTVTDDGTGNLVDSETFTVTVGDVNVAPVLAAIGDQSVNELVNLSFTATATDSDLPADTLTFSLDAASLALGMTIDANTGVFSWTPTEGQGGTTPSVTVTVTDDGTGNLVDSETFTITVGDVNVAPVLAAIGDQSVNELVNLSFTVTATDSDLPADTLTYSLDAASLALGMTIDANTGVFSWTPTEVQDGVHSVNITVTDDGTGTLTDSETFDITVNDVNVAPVLGAIGDQSVNELVNLSFTATATDSDMPADNLTYSLDAASLALGMTIDANTGVFSWTPTEVQDGVHSVSITVTDDGTGTLTDSEIFDITVNEVNVAPVLAAIGDKSVDELVNLTFTASATDADLPANNLTYSLDAASLALGMTIDANTGAFSWTPTEAQGGLTPSVTVTVTDDGTGNLVDSETITITVNDINVAPVLGGIGDQSVDELATLSFTATATDSDQPADNLTYSLDAASLALGMTIDANTGVFSWTPTETQGGITPSVTITVTDDGTGNLVDSETITITVNDINVAPVLGAIGDQSVNELATLSFTATATDSDQPADNLTFSLDAASLALGMTIDANTGAFSWTPTEAQGGLTPSVTITVTDDGTGNLVDSETITITVNDINVAPVLGAIGDQSIDELANLTFTATATDSDQPADNLTFSLDAASLALGMTIDANTGVFSWTPTEAQGGLTPSVTITVTDDGTGNLVDSETITITVNDVNVAPVLGAIGDQVVNELVNLTFTATATDADLPVDNLTFSLDAASLALGMTIDANTGVFSWTPTVAQGGITPSVTITVTDDGTGNLVDSETFTITVNPVNFAPVLGAIGDQSVDELVNLTFTATATDADIPADNLTYSLDAASLALGMTIDANTGVFSWTPTEAQGGLTPSVTITVTDDGTGTLADSETITITVNDINVAPVLGAIGDQAVDELANLTFTATATDSDLPADNLTFSLDAASLALGMTIDANTGVFSWTPTEAQGNLTPSVTITVTDDGSGNLVDSETITITVNDINVAPVLGAIGDQSIDELANLTFTATATDSDLPADNLTFSLDAASLALGMTIDANTGVFSWTPTEGQGGLTPLVTVTVTDDGTGNLVDSETFTITVGDVNVAPVLGAIGDQSVNELVNLSFTATATDSDLPADTLTFSLDAASLALGMTIDANTGVFSWTPTEGQGGLTPLVTVTVTDDGTGNLVDSETFTITVGDVNVAPVLGAIGDQSVNELVNLSFTATATDSDLPADTLTFSLDAASLALGMTIDANTGVFSWTPTEGQGGLTPSVTVTVTDDGTGNLVDSETFTITVGDVNVAPVLGAIGDQSVNELVNLSFTATATDSDLPADTLTFSLDAASLALGMTIDANTGVFIWTPTEGQGGLTASVTVTVTDDGTGNLVDSETFTITVGDVNVAPVLGAIGDQSVNELVNLSFTATATDSDLPADSLTFSLDAASLALGMTIDANTGVFSWTPTEGQGGLTPSVTVTVTDDGTGNLVDSETFTIAVNDVNAAPVLGAIGNQSVNELVNLSFTATATDSDLPADNLTFTLDAASLALGMTIDANTGVFNWTPTEGQGGLTPSVTVTVTDDGTGNLVDSETFTIAVNDVNAAPVLGAIGDQTVNELVNLSFTATATDSDLPADNLTFTLDAASLALGMTIDSNTGVFNWTPTEGQGGLTPSVTVTVTDDGTGNLVDSETFTVTVNNVNAAPVLGAIGDQTVNELVNLSFTATAADSDLPADTLTFSLDAASLALGMTIDANTGVFNWTPTEGQGGLTPSVTVTVTDDGTGNLIDSETFTITVSDVNAAPILGAIGDQSVNELVNLSFTATATDSDLPADNLTFTLDAASLALGMTIDANTGVFSWTPTEGQGGLTPSVTVTVTDDGTGNLIDSETFTITVGDVNVAPVLGAIGDQSVNELVNLSFTATATDSDLPADNLTFTLDAASLALGMTIDANTGVFNWTPTEGQGGLTPSVTVTVTDDGTGNLVDSETFTITVNDVNAAPVLGAIGDQGVNELVNLSFTATATDSDLPADTLTFSLDAASLALGMTIDANTGVFSWTPSAAQGGLTPSVTITVTDDGTGNLVDSETFTITVNPVNFAPVLGAIGDQSVNELVNLSFTATATDVDVPADTLTFSLDAASLALGMTIDANTGVFNWTPTEGQGGLTPSVTVTVTDDGTGNLVDSETFTITVGDVNVAPVLGAIGEQSVNELVNLSFTATATDSDLPADTLTFSLDAASLALGMTIDANTGVFSWTPTEGQGGLIPSVTVTVTDDGTGNLVDSETFTIAVNDVNAAPVLGAIGDQTVNELVNLSFTATATDSDLPADSLTFSLDAASLALGMTIDANTGVFSWTPTEAQGGLTPTVTVTVTDDGTGNLVDSETFTITVVDINITPVVSDVAINSVEDGVAVTGSFAVTDADTTDTHTFTLIGTPAEGSVVNNGNGTFTFDPGTDFQDLALGETRDVSFTYTATDDSGAANATSTTATVTVTVTGTNDTPTVGDVAINATEDSTTVTGSFVVSDVDATDTHTFDITSSPSEGTVLNNGNGTFTFDPGLAFQDLALGETRDVAFTYTATDDSGALNGISISATVTVTVAGTNDAPGTANSIITTNEDVSYTFTAADFSFSDIDGDAFAGLGITSLETAGSLQLNNTDISLNQFVTKADIDAGRLEYIPAANANGVGYDSFGFRVHDGTEYSASAYTVTLDVTPVNDVALGKPVITGSFEEGQVLTADTSAISDIDGMGAFSYQWYADGAVIAAATSGSYTLVSADVGSNITVAVSFTDAQGSNESVTSAATGAVAKEPDQATAPPKPDPVVYEDPVARIEDPLKTDPVTENQDPGNNITQLTDYKDLNNTGTGWIRPDEIPDYDVELYSDAPRTYEILRFDVRPILQAGVDIAEEMLQLFDLVRIKLGELDDQPAGVFIKSIGTVSASLSIGVVAWVMRGGSVLLSMLSSVSVMKGLDPMPLLERRKARKNGAGPAGTDEDERLDELFDGDVEKEESANTKSGKEDNS